MLLKFSVDNFKSHINATYEPGPFNLLVGMNNAGKTNFCQALRFLSLSVRLPLSEAIVSATGEATNLPNLFFDKKTIDFKCTSRIQYGSESLLFDYELSLTVETSLLGTSQTRTYKVKDEHLRVSGGPFQATTLLSNEGGSIKLLHERSFLTGDTEDRWFVATEQPTHATMLSRLYDLDTNRRANLFKKYLSEWQYYDFDTLQLRKTDAKPFDQILNPDGSNLSSVLYQLKVSDGRLFRKLLEALRSIDPKVEEINFFAPTQEQVYMFVEDGKGNRLGIQSLSNGTLKYIALTYVLLTNGNRTKSLGYAPLVIVEEPENGIYVGLLRELLKRIESSEASGQFIFTSHSPYFIDLFETKLDYVIVLKNLGATHSQLLKLPKEKVVPLLGEFSLGELHFRELLA